MTYRCSFCGKSQDQVQRLIAGPGGVYICNECVALCNEIIQDEDQQVAPGPARGTMPAPQPAADQPSGMTQNDRGASRGAEGEAGLRELGSRLLRESRNVPWLNVLLLPGELPPNLPFDLPLPPGARVVGTLVNPSWTRILLDIDYPVRESMLASYREQLLAADWTQRAVPANGGLIGGFRDSMHMEYMEPPFALTFTQEGWSLEVQGPATSAPSSRAAGLPTEMQLMLRAPAPPHIRHAPRMREPLLHAPSRFVPMLVPPAGARQHSMGGYGSADAWHLPARLQTDLDLAAILAHYAQYLEGVGWTRLGGEVCEVTAWSSWDVGAEDGEPWRGLFVACRWPEAPGEYLLTLHVLWAGAELETSPYL